MIKRNILFFGAGNIVTGYENNLDNCHLKSLNKNNKFNILGVVDSNIKNSEIFSKYSNSSIYNVNDLTDLDIDIIAICTPTNTHHRIIKELIANDIKPKCFFCEKPFTDSFKHAQEIFSLLKSNDIGLIIGYQRSFLSDFKRVSDGFRENKYGSLLHANVKYSKGLLNNGSHALDLLHYLFNDIQFKNFGNCYDDYSDSDLSVDVFFNYNDRLISLTALNEKSFSIFEVDIIFEKRRFRFTDNAFSLEEYTLQEDHNYPGYMSINTSGYSRTNMHKSLDEMWESIHHMISNDIYFDEERVLFPHKIVDTFKSCQ